METPQSFGDLRLGDLADRAAERWPTRTAVVFVDEAGREHRETYAEFSASVDEVARGLIACGVESGDHVGVWMTNRPEWLHLMCAIGKVGACLVPLNTRYRADDMAFTVINARCSHLVVLDRSGPIDYADLLAGARAEIEAAGHLRQVIMLGEKADGCLLWADALANGAEVSADALAARAAMVDPDQLMMLAYTSGTTGLPKGVMHSHRPINNVRERAQILGHTRNDVHLNYLPLFHIYALSEISMVALLTGGAQVLFDAFDGDRALDAVERYGATVLHGFDSHWNDLLVAQEQAARDLSSLRLGSLPAGMESTTPIALRSQAFCPTISGFGMSECWAFICVSSPSHSEDQRTTASGYPMDGIEVEVRDPETGAVIVDETPGQLYIRGYTVTSGYWDNPSATAATIDADGWLDTGDMAVLRDDGHVVFLGRYKDMLKVGGENMSPAEVEGYLLAMPGVSEVAVVAYPDERLAEVPVAYVVRAKDDPNAHADDVTEDALLEPLRGRIASYKIPRAVVFVDAMPMTPSGKIRKIELRERALLDLADPTTGS
ncbi:MAG: AMP-binding protein [Actinomycetota bacterium]